jgi:hypothetical protein
MPDIPLRDLIAMQAMNGLISSDGGIEKLKKATNMLLSQGENVEGTDVVALVSYELADAMLRRREVVETTKAKPFKSTTRDVPMIVDGRQVYR